MYSHNSNNIKKYTIKSSLLPLSSFPTPTKDSYLLFHCVFMLMHENSSIFYFLIFFTQKVVYYAQCFVTCFFPHNSGGNLFIISMLEIFLSQYIGFFVLFTVAKNFIKWMQYSLLNHLLVDINVSNLLLIVYKIFI